MKILFVNGHLNVGGVEKSLIDLLQSIDYGKHQVDLLLFEDYGDYLQQVPQEVNIILCSLQSTYGAFIPSILNAAKRCDIRTILLKLIFTMSEFWGVRCISLMKLLRITPLVYDCAIAYRVGIAAEYVGFAIKAKKKYMWWHHGEFDYPESLVNRWQKTSVKMDKIVCVSEYTRQMISPYFSQKKDDLIVIPNMILTEEIKEKALENNPYIESAKVKLVSVGRMSPEKHMIDCVEAMDILVKSGYCNLEWYLVGDGTERNSVEKEIIARNLQGKVICVGSQKNPYPYLLNADIFVHPSYVESQGISVLEALVLKKASIITKSGGVCEFVINGENGILVEKGPEYLANAIIELIENEDKRIRLQNRAKCPERFLKNSVMDKFYDIIKNY